jgi:hypothetical protein
MGRVQLAAVTVMLHRVPKPRFKRFLRCGVIAGEKCPISLAQFRQTGDLPVVDS